MAIAITRRVGLFSVCVWALLVLAGCQAGGGGASDQSAAHSAPVVEHGSTRGATVAMETAGGQREVTFLAQSLDEQFVTTLRETAPNVRLLVGLSDQEALSMADEVHGIDGRYCSPEFLREATNLRWVQALSAGVDWYLRMPELRKNDEIVLTNMQAVHGPTIADHVFGMLLALTRDLRYYLNDAQRGTWNRSGSGAERIALRDRTMLVVGLGGIGREVAQRAKGFGMRVLATRRSDVPPPAFVDEQGTPDDLDAFLQEADVVVLCVPLTDETRGMIGRDEFALMKEGTYLVNVARGAVVDTRALVQSLQRGHLAGACLDVTDPEPLPEDHVLWSMPNVVITPHVSSRSALTEDRRWALYVENVRRFGAGEPLLNVVDKAVGY